MFKQAVSIVALLLPALMAPAQSLPDKCVQLPERTLVCPNLMYKRSPIDVSVTETKAGEIVCICMADFANLRLPAESRTAEIDQQAELTRSSIRVGLSEQELLTLLRN